MLDLPLLLHRGSIYNCQTDPSWSVLCMCLGCEASDEIYIQQTNICGWCGRQHLAGSSGNDVGGRFRVLTVH